MNIYNIYLYCTWVSEWLSFTHRQVSFGATFTEQSSSSSNWFSPKGGRHVGEAHLPPSCCEADLRWWSLAGGLQCYDASASDGAIGTWRRLGWTNDVFHLGVSCCTMIPSHSIWYTYIYIFLYDDSRWTKPGLNLSNVFPSTCAHKNDLFGKTLAWIHWHGHHPLYIGSCSCWVACEAWN